MGLQNLIGDMKQKGNHKEVKNKLKKEETESTFRTK